ncbi:hypothetical protein [Ruegeria atlantica]|uniref:hypothetical protein n=1 Tax=Ruegeria atlantica TaxID=81569 RepID=UPI0014812C9E|nr:hypothetical protein [Ruegeria atlantica]
MKVEALKSLTIFILSGVMAFVAVSAPKAGKDLTVTVKKNGTIGLDALDGQSLTQLLDNGFEAVQPAPEDGAETTARKLSDMRTLTRTLESLGYYALNDPELVHEIKGLENYKPVSVRLRGVLLEGIKAEPHDDSQLFATLYTNFIQREAVFSPLKHEVTAEGVLLYDPNGNEKPIVYTCPDRFLKPGITIPIKPKGGSSNIMPQFTARQDPVFHVCAARATFEFLSGSEMKLGLNRVAFDQLFPSRMADAEQFQGRGTLSVMKFPRNTQPALFTT